MRKVVLFLAMSLDGYIADRNGKVDWLTGEGADEETPDVYSEFIKDVDTVIMGWNTYYQVRTELSPKEWVYKGQKCYVITHRDLPDEKEILFTREDPGSLVERLKSEEGKHIWICGGANLIQQLVTKDLIDEYYLTVIPTLLGSGIRLFQQEHREIQLKLVHTQKYNGIVDLVYNRR